MEPFLFNVIIKSTIEYSGHYPVLLLFIFFKVEVGMKMLLMVLTICIPCYIKPVHTMTSLCQNPNICAFLESSIEQVKSWFMKLVLCTPYRTNLESEDHLFLIPLAHTYLNWIKESSKASFAFTEVPQPCHDSSFIKYTNVKNKPNKRQNSMFYYISYHRTI